MPTRQIWEEMRRLTPDFGGIDFARLEREGGVHWPCPAFDHPGSPFLFQDDFPRGRGKFWTLEFGTASELPDDDYPFLLSTGRVLYHWHGGTLSRRSKLDGDLARGHRRASPDDARLGLATGIGSRSLLARRDPMQVMVTGDPAGGWSSSRSISSGGGQRPHKRPTRSAPDSDFKVCASS
jgi:hypothetical protein